MACFGGSGNDDPDIYLYQQGIVSALREQNLPTGKGRIICR